MSGCNGCDLLITADAKLSKAMCPPEKDELALMATRRYRAVVGSLMYLMLGTRPDLTYAVREYSQFLHNPGILQWKAAKRALRYVSKTLDYGLEIGTVEFKGRGLDGQLCAYTDADFANRVDDRKSIAGYLTM